jgi:hypothetical protein
MAEPLNQGNITMNRTSIDVTGPRTKTLMPLQEFEPGTVGTKSAGNTGHGSFVLRENHHTTYETTTEIFLSVTPNEIQKRHTALTQ